jgi:hypothetical protein
VTPSSLQVPPSPCPIFLLSLPRAGSTFVQRVLASHQQVATVSEPWLLIPFLYTLKQEGVVAEYGHRIMVKAIEDFCGELPRGSEDYLEEIRTLALRLYAKATPDGATYFLDKTPRYHLIVDDLFRLFPEGKFVFLWRNPLAVAASIIETWGGGRWSIPRFRLDLFRGLDNLVTAYGTHGERAIALRYEDMIQHPESEYGRILEYLDLPADPEWISRLPHAELAGRMGDRGAASAEAVKKDPLAKWRLTLATPVRKAWCLRYLRWIGQERLSVMGYDLEALVREIEALPSKPRLVASDAVRLSFGAVTRSQAIRALFRASRRYPAPRSWGGRPPRPDG